MLHSCFLSLGLLRTTCFLDASAFGSSLDSASSSAFALLVLHDPPVRLLLPGLDVSGSHVLSFFNAILDLFKVPADDVVVETARE